MTTVEEGVIYGVLALVVIIFVVAAFIAWPRGEPTSRWEVFEGQTRDDFDKDIGWRDATSASELPT